MGHATLFIVLALAALPVEAIGVPAGPLAGALDGAPHADQLLMKDSSLGAYLRPEFITGVRDVGFGDSRLGGPCAPVGAFIYIRSGNLFSRPHPVLLQTESPIASGTLGPGKDCYGRPMKSYSKLLINATDALTTCGACAVVTSQHWLEQASPGSHVNDFTYVVFRGEGILDVDGPVCWAAYCDVVVYFSGDGVLAELYDSRVPPEIPCTGERLILPASSTQPCKII